MIPYILLFLSLPSPQPYETVMRWGDVSSVIIIDENPIASPAPTTQFDTSFLVSFLQTLQPYPTLNSKPEFEQNTDERLQDKRFSVVESFTKKIDPIIYPQSKLSSGFDNNVSEYFHSANLSTKQISMEKSNNYSKDYTIKSLEALEALNSFSIIQYDPEIIEYFHIITQNSYMIIGEIIFMKIFLLLMIYNCIKQQIQTSVIEKNMMQENTKMNSVNV